MKQIFVDTNAWIALNSKRDQFHQISQKINQDLLSNGCLYITTSFVLDETYTGLLTKVNHAAAVDFGERIRASKIATVVHVSKLIEEKSWEVFKKFTDKKFSFTDCSSFVVMQLFNLQEAFTNDHHFEQMGFQVLMKSLQQ